jgi:hypothetical protein
LLLRRKSENKKDVPDIKENYTETDCTKFVSGKDVSIAEKIFPNFGFSAGTHSFFISC